MEKVFDFHFHLLFKHYVTDKTKFKPEENVKTTGIGKLFNDVMGGAFDSQSSPSQISKSNVSLGVISILSLEHAFANRILTLTVLGRDINLREILPMDWKYVDSVRDGNVSYYEDLLTQIDLHINALSWLKGNPYNVEYLLRDKWTGKSEDQVAQALESDGKRYFALSMEGGHNLSDVKIHRGIPSRFPELRLKELQDRNDVDFMCMNLCHLSYIPEQNLGGFSQGLNGLSQVAFSSEDFCPKPTLGISELGKKVVRQALTHKTKPVLIDVKHMSAYTRFHYYRIREKLIAEQSSVARLPIMTSHTGFTFSTLSDFIKLKKFKSSLQTQAGQPVTKIECENKKIGRTDDRINSGLFCNPWTINLFDEEITEIMASRGLIGISLDQRILGASNPAADSIRDKYFEGEHIAQPEFERLFRDGQLPTAERFLEGLFPSREERHSMLLCLHLIHAVRVGYATLAWQEGTSPWDHICIGSDFDGLINPINGVDDVTQFPALREQLLSYLPQAEKSLEFHSDIQALKRTSAGDIDKAYLNTVVDKFMYRNGQRFIARFLTNWGIA